MNNVTLVGRLAKDIELKDNKNGTKYVYNTVAVNRNDKERKADFIRFKSYGHTAEFIAKYFKKGEPIEITGRIQVDQYTRDDGTQASDTYIFVSEAGFVPRSSGEGSKPIEDAAKPQEAETAPSLPDEPVGELPFEI